MLQFYIDEVINEPVRYCLIIFLISFPETPFVKMFCNTSNLISLFEFEKKPVNLDRYKKKYF
jgi:hypothetical protein